MKILTIDGGGLRVAYSARILQHIQHETGIDFCKEYDLIAGTSSGSILAAALSIGYPIDKAVDLYRSHGDVIFKKRLMGWQGIFHSRYTSDQLRPFLEREFEGRSLAQTNTRLMILATNISNGNVHAFHPPGRPGGEDISLVDAVLASCSAPTYFDPTPVGRHLFADGGLWANNPTLACIIEAMTQYKVPLHELKILSIGTGMTNYRYQDNRKGWGFFTGWGGSRLIKILFNLQSNAIESMTDLLLGKDQYLRISFDQDEELPLDKPHAVESFIERADRDFAERHDEIMDFYFSGSSKLPPQLALAS